MVKKLDICYITNIQFYFIMVYKYSYVKQLNYTQNVLNLNSIVIAKNKYPDFFKNLHIFESSKLDCISIYDDGYMLYSNGMIYSNYTNKWLKHYPYRSSSKNKIHFTVGLKTSKKNKAKTIYVSRLVMFFFSKHNYKDIMDMPIIEFKNESNSNPLKFDISNMYFSTMQNVLATKVAKFKIAKNTKISNTKQNIERITNYLKSGKTLKFIGDKYDCSEMSVVRFKQRNGIIL